MKMKIKKAITSIAAITILFAASGGEQMTAVNWAAMGISIAWLMLVAIATMKGKVNK